jgi:threonine dehydrogenase-like Zn-dependent dehydrogenase
MSTQLPQTMRAAVLHGRNDLRVQDCPVPTPGPLEVLMQVFACAICGTDPRVIGEGWTGMPPYGSFIPGHEYSGRIVAIGPGVTGFQVGDRVAIESHKGCGHCINCKRGRYTICLNYGKPEAGHRHYGFTSNGGYAQYAVNHVSTLYRISDRVSYEEAALVTTAACVHFALDNVGGLLGGETVAVLGPGPIGLMGVQLVKALGATKVILTGTREERLRVGRSLGADVTVNVREQDAVAVVKAETGGMGADLVLECSGSSEAAAQAIEMTCRGARISFIGDPHTLTTINLRRFVLEDLRAAGVRGEGMADCQRSLALLAAGKIVAKPMITHHFPLEQINDGLQTFIQRKGGALKVIVQPNG